LNNKGQDTGRNVKGKHGDAIRPAGEMLLKLNHMKTIIQKVTEKQEAVTALFVIGSLLLFFAVVIYNSVSHGIGI
jgi:hypothetical protein